MLIDIFSIRCCRVQIWASGLCGSSTSRGGPTAGSSSTRVGTTTRWPVRPAFTLKASFFWFFLGPAWNVPAGPAEQAEPADAEALLAAAHVELYWANRAMEHAKKQQHKAREEIHFNNLTLWHQARSNKFSGRETRPRAMTFNSQAYKRS